MNINMDSDMNIDTNMNTGFGYESDIRRIYI
jgi:hypothetical protein